jgi:hypothetical protein
MCLNILNLDISLSLQMYGAHASCLVVLPLDDARNVYYHKFVSGTCLYKVQTRFMTHTSKVLVVTPLMKAISHA